MDRREREEYIKELPIYDSKDFMTESKIPRDIIPGPTVNDVLILAGYKRVGEVKAADKSTLDVIAAIAGMSGVEVQVLGRLEAHMSEDMRLCHILGMTKNEEAWIVYARPKQATPTPRR